MEQLPVDCLGYLLRFLQPVDILALLRTNRRWGRVVTRYLNRKQPLNKTKREFREETTLTQNLLYEKVALNWLACYSSDFPIQFHIRDLHLTSTYKRVLDINQADIFSALPRLESLRLDGPIGYIDCQVFLRLPQLTRLRFFAQTQIHNSDSIGQLTQLTRLYVENYKSHFSSWQGLTKLVHLTLTVRAPPWEFLSRLPQLTHVKFRNPGWEKANLSPNLYTFPLLISLKMDYFYFRSDYLLEYTSSSVINFSFLPSLQTLKIRNCWSDAPLDRIRELGQFFNLILTDKNGMKL